MIRFPHLALVCLAAPSSAQTAPPGPAASETQAIARASAIGSALFAFDRAAWVATDALKAKLPAERIGAIGGWVVEPAADRTLTVTFYTGRGEAAQAAFVASVRAGKLVDARVMADPVALTEPQRRLVAAREAALAEAASRKYTPCTASPFNTVVLPSPQGNGPIAVYLLSAPVKASEYPLGGHYCVIVGADGKAITARPYSVGCLTMTVPKLPAGATPVGLFVNHLFDPVPTEIHVFASFAARMPLMVGTRDKRVWQVAGARITAVPGKV